MSTFTTNYGLEKPELGDRFDNDVLNRNLRDMEKIFQCIYERSAELTGPEYFLTFDTLGGTVTNGVPNNLSLSAITRITNQNGGGYTDGSTWYWADYNGGGGEFYWGGFPWFAPVVPGIYRITYNVRLTLSNSTMTEGLIETGLINAFTQTVDNRNEGVSSIEWVTGIVPGSVQQVMMNTMTTVTDVSHSFLYYVDKPNVFEEYEFPYMGMVGNTDDWYAPSYDPILCLYVQQANTSSATGTVTINSTWHSIEYVRGL